ncbi:MAG: M56 family metallopeptidase [Alphaproteobacteria bacterium]|nr:M56 family metallopeptidase [Alphaproteobacteria bacterium]
MGVLSLGALALCAPLTFALLRSGWASPAELVPWAPLNALGCSLQSSTQGLLQAWGLGAGLLLLRLAGGLLLGERYRRGAWALPSALEAEAEALAARMGLGGRVRFRGSSQLGAPAVVGLSRPTVLLPRAAIEGLSPAQLRAVLAHELSHVQRGDAWVNLGQCLAEALLFFHPAVWWISSCVRMEREHCCDDAASGYAQGVDLARALGALAGASRGPRALLAGTGGLLLQRVRRLLGGRARPLAPLSRAVAIWMVLASLVGLAGMRYDPGACEARPRSVAALVLPDDVGAQAVRILYVIRRRLPTADIELRRPRFPRVL